MLRERLSNMKMMKWINAAMRQRTKRFATTVASVSMLLFLATLTLIGDSLPEEEALLYEPIEPEVTHDFPIIRNANATIPKIIHQIWNDFIVPTEYVENVKLIIKYNPDWQYFFWTMNTGRQFLSKHFPRLLTLYNTYTRPIDKSDLLRYAILYKYGGAFLDLDFVTLRSFDRIVGSFPCVLVREPPEHAAILYKAEMYLANGVIFTRPGHPFLAHVINSLHAFQHFLFPSGTKVFTSLFLLYNTSNDDVTFMDSVYVTPSQYFLPEIDPTNHRYFRKACNDFEPLSPIQRRGCASYIRRYIMQLNTPNIVYTDHIWGHSWKLSFDENNHIRMLVPRVIIYDASS